MDFKYRTWAEAAAAWLKKEIVDTIESLAIESVTGGPPLSGVGDTPFIGELPDSFQRMEQAFYDICDLACLSAYPKVLDCAITWDELERAVEANLCQMVTESLMRSEGLAAVLHRVRLVVRRPYDRPLIIASEYPDLVINDECHRVMRQSEFNGRAFAWIVEAYKPTDAVSDAMGPWLVQFLKDAPDRWVLTRAEIDAQLMKG